MNLIEIFEDNVVAFKYSRRNFISSAALAGLAPVGASCAFNSNAEQKTVNCDNTHPSRATADLLSLLNIRYPIIQAPTGSAVISDMTAAVSNSGALGAIPLSWSSAHQAAETITDVQSRTKDSFFANFVLSFEPVALPAALDSGTGIIQFSWGMPSSAMIDAIRSVNAVMGIQVTSKESAETALDLGADYLVCQGMEAGGHVHASKPLARALEEVLGVAGNVPVAASGGIATGHKMREYMQMGAAGVVMGSRFVASKESAAHDQYKKALIDSNSEDTVFTTCMNKGWDNATHRILRNSTFKMWESAGCPSPGTRPGETDVIATYGRDKTIERYSVESPNRRYSGDIEAMAVYAGMGVNEISDAPTVEKIISRVWSEFLDV
jgi:nitronate monooxygenase